MNTPSWLSPADAASCIALIGPPPPTPNPPPAPAPPHTKKRRQSPPSPPRGRPHKSAPLFVEGPFYIRNR